MFNRILRAAGTLLVLVPLIGCVAERPSDSQLAKIALHEAQCRTYTVDPLNKLMLADPGFFMRNLLAESACKQVSVDYWVADDQVRSRKQDNAGTIGFFGALIGGAIGGAVGGAVGGGGHYDNHQGDFRSKERNDYLSRRDPAFTADRYYRR